jgi:hypothetical protein
VGAVARRSPRGRRRAAAAERLPPDHPRGVVAASLWSGCPRGMRMDGRRTAGAAVRILAACVQPPHLGTRPIERPRIDARLDQAFRAASASSAPGPAGARQPRSRRGWPRRRTREVPRWPGSPSNRLTTTPSASERGSSVPSRTRGTRCPTGPRRPPARDWSFARWLRCSGRRGSESWPQRPRSRQVRPLTAGC